MKKTYLMPEIGVITNDVLAGVNDASIVNAGETTTHDKIEDTDKPFDPGAKGSGSSWNSWDDDDED